MTSWFACVTCVITLGTSCAQTTWRLCCARRLKMDHMSVGMYCRMSQDVTWSFDFSSRYFQCTDKHDAGDKFFSWFDRSTGQRATRQQYLFPRCAYYEQAQFLNHALSTSVSDLLKRRKFDEDDVAAIMSIHQSTGDSSIGKQSSDDSDYSQPADDESVSEEEEEK